MESYTEEQFEQIPEFLRGEYTKQDDGTYVHGMSKTLKESLNEQDEEYKALNGQFSALKYQMSEFESKKADEIESAKARALEEARSKKDVDEIERQYEEKMKDLESRVEERTRNEVTKEFTMKQAADSLSSDIKLLASELAVDEQAKLSLEVLISQRAKIDENGKRGYFGEDGVALSIDNISAFKEELEKSSSLERLIKGHQPSSSGGANGGGSGGGSAKGVNAEAEEAKKNRDGIGHLNAYFKEAFK